MNAIIRAAKYLIPNNAGTQKLKAPDNSMKDLYIHIGFPRTATTTLQLRLFKNHKDLNYLGRFTYMISV